LQLCILQPSKVSPEVSMGTMLGQMLQVGVAQPPPAAP